MSAHTRVLSIPKQDITVANPPTLLLLVDKLLRDLDHSVSDVGDADAEGVCVSGSDGHTESPPGCSEGRGEDTHEVEPTMEFLRKAYPLLDRWMRWLLVTQRPGAEGWGGQTKRAPLGAFQVHTSMIPVHVTTFYRCVYYHTSYAIINITHSLGGISEPVFSETRGGAHTTTKWRL